jgi:hypothetical protein
VIQASHHAALNDIMLVAMPSLLLPSLKLREPLCASAGRKADAAAAAAAFLPLQCIAALVRGTSACVCMLRGWDTRCSEHYQLHAAPAVQPVAEHRALSVPGWVQRCQLLPV